MRLVSMKVINLLSFLVWLTQSRHLAWIGQYLRTSGQSVFTSDQIESWTTKL